ncbi:hypothetical protein N7499_000760 [Penicillium canescens]|uniref:Uncharacterized protein n=1 Tax=Penicillium canescens TaxID=5083 RepID=A0AAD6IHG6_PENCN|nr:uncharacterized protein N7446_011034 [Penicillium canescens]KAJ6007096.1 hypothetical protein N7522_005447 [Penicillium canescens]KAJ6029613.1 hypothetical protein N7444_012600 [Penicillium canescens]KAJ6048045.1 hypothetical protein N7460_004192 [Penicillium canescens]KAJ6048351.1 hypothetical protein N7446_011034 [Penicillium canescens]KAJ6101130.1 hypothetical protein N7499_000760 [Penicillium canescens]
MVGFTLSLSLVPSQLALFLILSVHRSFDSASRPSVRFPLPFKPLLSITTSTMDAGFKIGIELELLLDPKRRNNKDFADLDDFAQFITRPIAMLRAVPHLE